MADVDVIFERFVADHRAGGPADPATYLRELDVGDRRELAALIDGYLERAPRRAWDPEAFAEFAASPAGERVGRAAAGEGGLWPVLLPRLREAARVRRGEVVSRLADALGAGGEAGERRVGIYYHGMEQGTLPAAGVSARVLEALAAIVGTTADRLREAGATGGPVPESPGGAAPAAAMARQAWHDAARADESPGAPGPEATVPPAPGTGVVGAAGAQPDELDRLFTGGGG